jgi:hypothetical protein
MVINIIIIHYRPYQNETPFTITQSIRLSIYSLVNKHVFTYCSRVEQYVVIKRPTFILPVNDAFRNRSELLIVDSTIINRSHRQLVGQCHS